MNHLRLACRSLLRSPLVSAVAVLSLALGIGANAAIFTLFESMVLRALPVPAPDELVNLLAPGPKSGSQSSNVAGGVDSVFSYPMFRDLEREQTSFAGIAAHRAFSVNLTVNGSTENTEGMLVSGRYFELLDLRPALGRLLGPDDDRTPGAHPLVVLGHGYWRTHFDSSPTVLNSTLIVNGQQMTIVGVAPPGFEGTTLGERPRVFVPITMRDALLPRWPGFDNRRSYWVYAFGRLEPGTSLEQAAAAINSPYRAILSDVEVPLQQGMSAETLERFRTKELVLEPGARGQSEMHQEARGPLLQLFAVTGLVLLLACANVANLLLSKAANRSGETMVRLSIGARRRHLVSQPLAESLVLGACGGALGLLVAHATLGSILSILPPDASEGLTLEIGPPAWLFLIVLSFATGLLGLLPGWQASKPELVSGLKGQGDRSASSKLASRFRTFLASAQIALSMALLISAGLFIKSLYNVSRVDLGIDTAELATFGVSPELNGYSPSAAQALFQRIEDELGAFPGITAVTASVVPLISGSNWGTSVAIEGFSNDPDIDRHTSFNEIGPGYFATLGIPLITGRELRPSDTLGAPKVALVNEAFARKFELGRDVVGKRVGRGTEQEIDTEIVGLVRDAKYSDVKDPVPPQLYLPYRQNEELATINFYVRTAGDPAGLLPQIRSVVSGLDGNLPIENLRTMTSQVQESVVLDRMLSILSAAFAILATVLAAIGLYGVVSYRVSQRTREIGLRMALGADGPRVRMLVLRQVAIMAVPGALVGVAAALGLGRLAASLLFELEGHDPLVIAAAALLLALVALGAGLVPAQRAASIDPMQALRSE